MALCLVSRPGDIPAPAWYWPDCIWLAGSTFPEIGKNEIIKIKAFCPDQPEQEKIASCLSLLDDVITAETQKLITLKNLLKDESEKYNGYLNGNFLKTFETLVDKENPDMRGPQDVE